ncbi:MAG: hypothetical protein MJ230_07605 [bacterium]|nr:hypothetical protein [bacterium]
MNKLIIVEQIEEITRENVPTIKEPATISVIGDEALKPKFESHVNIFMLITSHSYFYKTTSYTEKYKEYSKNNHIFTTS